MEWESVEDHRAIRMTRFYMQSVGMWYVEKKRDKIISNVVLVYTVLAMLIAIVTIVADCYYSLGDLHAISYNAPCTTTVLVESMKLLVFIVNRQKVMEFNAFTENTFWKIKYELADREILSKCNTQVLRMNGLLAVLLQMIAFHYLSIPLVESHGKNSSERTLPFRLWFDLPFTETPYYEVAYGLEAAGCLSVAVCATTFGSFLFTICIYATGQFKILQRRLKICCDTYMQNTTDGRSVKQAERMTFDDLKVCIVQHQMLIQYMDNVESLYCYIMLGQALGAALQICFSGFQIVLGAEESIQRTILSMEFLGGSITLLYLFSWACHEIIVESTAVAESSYKATWYILPDCEWGRAYRSALLMIVMRARKPCILTVGKFAPMSLETFMSVFSTSISYFTILRQMNEENQ